MKRILAFGLIAALGSALNAQTVNVRGKVSNDAGQAVANAVVELLQQGLRDTTGSDGGYSIIRPSVPIRIGSAALSEGIRLDRSTLEFTVGEPSLVKVEVFDANGNLRKKQALWNAQPGVYHANLANLPYSNRMLMVRASIGPLVRAFRYLPSREDASEGGFTIASPKSAFGMLAKIAAAVDSLQVSAVGYASKKIGLASLDTTVNVTLTDVTAVYNPCPTNGTPCKILPFGDSITEGVASSDGAGYRSQLFKLIVAANQKVTFVGSQSKGPTTVAGAAFPRSHEGRPGWGIAPGAGGFSPGQIYSLVPSPALNGAPHIILLHIGANEVFSPGTEGMATRLETLIEKIVQNAPTALIVLAKHTPIGTANGTHTQAEVDAANAAQQAFNAKIPGIIQAQVAKGRHIIGVDMSKMPLSGLSSRSMHPNNQGYTYMAGIWYDGIKNLLPK